MGESLLDFFFFLYITNIILLFTNITSLEDESFNGGFGLSESSRKAREQRKNENFAKQLGTDILDFYMNLSSLTSSVPNKCNMQLDENSGGSVPKKHKNVSKIFDSKISTATDL